MNVYCLRMIWLGKGEISLEGKTEQLLGVKSVVKERA